MSRDCGSCAHHLLAHSSVRIRRKMTTKSSTSGHPFSETRCPAAYELGSSRLTRSALESCGCWRRREVAEVEEFGVNLRRVCPPNQTSPSFAITNVLDGLRRGEIMRRAGTSKVTAWRWQERLMGLAGLLSDKTRPSRIPPLPTSVHERRVALTLGDPPGEATHWTAAMRAKPLGAADLAGARTAAAPSAPVQAVARPEFRPQDAVHQSGSNVSL